MPSDAAAADADKRAVRLVKNRWLNVGLAVGMVLIIGVLAGISFPRNGPQANGWQQSNLANAKQIALGLKLYADDHAGKLPGDLQDLGPQYVPDGLLERLKYLDPKTKEKYDWLCFLTKINPSPSHRILLASPIPFLNDQHGYERAVVFEDQSSAILPETDFMAEVAREMRGSP